MNAVFTAIFICSAAVLCALAPQQFLPAMTGGVRTAIAAALTLFCVYAVWMGLTSVAEKCGITRGVAKLMRPLCRKAFRTRSDEACEAAAMNLACDLLGAGASTPFAVKAVRAFEKEGNGFAQKLLFIINCAGFQLIPSTVITLRAEAGSASAADIFLPSLICSAATLAVSCGLFLLTEYISKRVRDGRGRKSGASRCRRVTKAGR